MPQTSTLVPLAILLAVSTVPAPASAVGEVSTMGLSCDGSLIADRVCAHATFTTWWEECEDNPEYGPSCLYMHSLTLFVPAGHCGIVQVQGIRGAISHGLSFCTSTDDTEFTAYYPWEYREFAYEAFNYEATVCLDTTDLGSPQCAHWYHVSSPAPGQGVPDSSEQFRMQVNLQATAEFALAHTQEGGAPVGVNVYNLP